MAKRLLTMDDLPLDGKTVLLRADLNVTVGDDGVIDATEDYRIQAVVPTVEELVQRRCRVLLLTHHGRPQEASAETSMAPIHRRLEELLREPIKQTAVLTGPGVTAVAQGLEPGAVVLLPNVREDQRELTESQSFARELADLAQAYVNEAFSVSHRQQTSVSLVPTLLPACAGRRTVQEVAVLEQLRRAPQTPYVAIASGAKLHTKVNMLTTLLEQVDTLCVGGRIANVLLAAQGACPTTGFDVDELSAARQVLNASQADKLLLPSDVVIGDAVGEQVQVVAVSAIPGDSAGVWDIGPKTRRAFADVCQQAKTILWNGPVGRVEVPAYGNGTIELARALAEVSAFRVVGGGDTVNVLERLKLVKRYDHVSVGGGALVAYLDGAVMPGLEPLYETDG